jgi:hypothetical protein
VSQQIAKIAEVFLENKSLKEKIAEVFPSSSSPSPPY